MRTLGIVVCVWKRPALTALTLRRNLDAAIAAAGKGDFQLKPLVVTSEDAEAMPRVEGWEYIHHDNQPLSNKWNAGMSWMKERGGIDAVMIIGSDDLVHENIFAAAMKALFPEAGPGVEWFGVLDNWVLHTASWKSKHWLGYPKESGRHGETIGTCRTFRKDLLNDFADWKIWPEGLARGLDRAFAEQVSGVEGMAVTSEQIQGHVIDVKAYPLHDIGSFWSAEGEERPGASAFDGFPSELREEVKKVCTPLATAEKIFLPYVSELEPPPLVTACLLVKNEAAMIGTTLASLKNFATEVLVLDTGSDDGTPEIAEAYGASVRRVKADQPFDFAKWRNESLVGARGKWVLIMDGDEWMERTENLLQELSDVPDKVDAIAFQHQVLGQKAAEGHSVLVRLLRGDKVRSGEIYYEYPNQHQLRGVDSFQLANAITLEPWFDPVESALRGIPILEKMLADSTRPRLVGRNGVDHALGGRTNEQKHALLYLSRNYAMLGSAEKDTTKRRLFFEKASLHAGALVDKHPEQLGAWLVLLATVEQSRGLLSIEPILGKALIQHPKCRDLHWWAMRLHAARLATLLVEQDTYPLVPQRWPEYWRRLKDVGPLLWMNIKIGGEQGNT